MTATADGETSSVGAAGAAPGPPGFATVAVLSIGVIGGAADRDARVEHDRGAAVRGHGNIADVDAAGAVRARAGARRRVDGAGGNADDCEASERDREIVDDANGRCRNAGRLDERDGETHDVAGIRLAAVQVDDASSSTSRDSARRRPWGRTPYRWPRSHRSSRSRPTAVLTTVGTAEPVAATVNAIGGSALPESSGGGCVHVTTCAATAARPAAADATDELEPRRQRVRDDDGVVLALPTGRVRDRQRVDVGAADREIADVRLRQRQDRRRARWSH